MRRRIVRWGFAAALGCAPFWIAAGADAQPSPDAHGTALALFDEGRRLMAAGNFAEACPKLAESQRLEPGIGALYNLSNCYEGLGRSASAWMGFREVAALSAAAKQDKREKDARGRASALEPKLSRLRISVQAGAGVEIARNGVVVGEPSWGVAIPVDPGQYVVKASAPGKTPWETKVAVEGEGAVINVEVPPLEPRRGAPGPAPPQGTPRPPSAPAAPAPRPPIPDDAGAQRPRGWQLPLGGVALGLGAAGLGVGTTLGFVAKSTADDADCNDADACTEDGLETRRKARGQGDIGTAVFVAGAVLAAGGVVLVITAPSDKAAKRAAAGQPRPPRRRETRIGIAPAGLVVQGTW